MPAEVDKKSCYPFYTKRIHVIPFILHWLLCLLYTKTVKVKYKRVHDVDKRLRQRPTYARTVACNN